MLIYIDLILRDIIQTIGIKLYLSATGHNLKKHLKFTQQRVKSNALLFFHNI